MIITHQKGMKMGCINPTYLCGYGGFNISLTSRFSASRIVLLRNGKILAIPNLRGGGEYGEKWHQSGMKMNKQNVFDDFIATRQHNTLRNTIPRAPKSWPLRGSNGGLSVGATMTQRPNLMDVAFPEVGVMNMLRYHKFTAGAG